MPIEFAARNGVRFIKNVRVPMSDGVQLAMDLHLPDSDDWQMTPRPVILEYTPYRKDDAAPYVGLQAAVAQHGYIGARLDCRGTGSSEGVNTDEYSPLEQQDGVEAIEWIARQPWSSGKIAMFGSSYGGFTSIQIAAHRPPHLTTIIPMYFTDDRYTDDCHYRGGALRCYYDVGAYGASMIGMNAMPPYPEYSGDDWARLWEQQLENNVPYLLTWLDHPRDDAYWRAGSVRDRYDQIACPVFMIGGWRDGYTNPPLRTFIHLKTPKKVLVGPWNHARPDSAIPGPRIDWVSEVVRWCDYWLKGEQNGVMDEPAVCIYMQMYDEPRADRLLTSGYWRLEPTFPIPESGERTLYLDGGGRLDDAAPTGGEEVWDEFEYRPGVGATGGLWSGGVPFGLPVDQRPDEVYSLNYTSEPLNEAMEIIGWPRVELYVRSSAPVMAFVARLSDVAPDGTSALVCNGVINGTRRESLTAPTPLDPNQTYRLAIELDATTWRFEPGHRIRLSICSADFPNLWPTPLPGQNRVYRDAAHPSNLVLPVVPMCKPVDQTQFAAARTPIDVYRLAPNEPVWQIVQDMMGDRVGLKMRRRSTDRPSAATEIVNDGELEVWVSQRDPAQASAVGRHHRRITRREGVTTIDTLCLLRSTETAFHLTIDLDVVVNESPHHRRRWVRTFPRDML